MLGYRKAIMIPSSKLEGYMLVANEMTTHMIKALIMSRYGRSGVMKDHEGIIR